jgi:hypothetical protein
VLHRAFLSLATLASLTIALGTTASAADLGQTSYLRVGTGDRVAAVLLVYPRRGFTAALQPSSVAGGTGSGTSTAGGAAELLAQAPAYGTITLTARHHDGAEAIDVTGTAPPGTSVEITARARISIDLPVVFLNRFYALADASGAFSVLVPIAPDYVAGSQVIVQADAPGDNSATASYIVGPPSVGPPIQSMDVCP